MDEEPWPEPPLSHEEVRELRSLFSYFKRKRERDEMVQRLQESPIEARKRTREEYKNRED